MIDKSSAVVSKEGLAAGRVSEYDCCTLIRKQLYRKSRVNALGKTAFVDLNKYTDPFYVFQIYFISGMTNIYQPMSEYWTFEFANCHL